MLSSTLSVFPEAGPSVPMPTGTPASCSSRTGVVLCCACFR